MRFSHLSALTISLLFSASHAATIDLVDRVLARPMPATAPSPPAAPICIAHGTVLYVPHPLSLSRRSSRGYALKALQGMPQSRRILRRCCTLLHGLLRLDPQRQRSFSFSPTSVSRTDGHLFSVLQVKEEEEGRVLLGRTRYPPEFKYTP